MGWVEFKERTGNCGMNSNGIAVQFIPTGFGCYLGMSQGMFGRLTFNVFRNFMGQNY